MKLIDLLVQELPKRGGWPLHVKSLEQCHDGCIQAFVGPAEYHARLPLAEDWQSVVEYLDYQAALDASQQHAWDGKGLPPVGTICEALSPVGRGEPWSWQRVKVVESGIEGAEKECLVYNLETTAPSWVDELRPIRTEADRKREEVIASMRNAVTNYNKTDVIYAIGQVYDAIAAGQIAGVKLEDAK